MNISNFNIGDKKVFVIALLFVKEKEQGMEMETVKKLLFQPFKVEML
mgnify:CR=1 FL=1